MPIWRRAGLNLDLQLFSVFSVVFAEYIVNHPILWNKVGVTDVIMFHTIFSHQLPSSAVAYPSYEIKFQSENAVSFTVDFGEAWVTAAQERYCYNLDLAENRDITLRDLLGDAWVERCNQAVQSYIAAHTDEHGYTLFFDPEAGGFTTVDENTRFYIRADGVPVLVFQEYTIAAGSAGIVEIPVEDIQT